MLVRIPRSKNLGIHGITKTATGYGLQHTRIANDVYEVIDRNLFLVSVIKHEIEFSSYAANKHIRVMEWNKYDGSHATLGLQLGPFPYHYYIFDEKKFMIGVLEHGIDFEEVEDV
jgi:hypothetical protein